MFQKQKKIMATLSATSSSISACLASIVSNSVILATWLLEHIFWADFTLKEDLVKEILTWGSSPLMYIPSSIWSRSPHGKQGDEEGGKVCEYNLKIKKWKLKDEQRHRLPLFVFVFVQPAAASRCNSLSLFAPVYKSIFQL